MTDDTLHIPKQSTPSSLRCRHIGPEDRRCGSPAMRGESFCYHHHQTRRPVENLRQRRARQSTFSLPQPNSRNDIQQALGTIMVRIAANDIDLRRAGLLLYALQIANSNLNHHQNHQTRSTTHLDKTKSTEEASAPTEHPQPNRASEQTHSTSGQDRSVLDPTPSAPEQTHLAHHRVPSSPRQNHFVRTRTPSGEESVSSGVRRVEALSAPKQKCHPERSAAESKDLRFDLPPELHSKDQAQSPEPDRTHYGSGPVPDLAHPQNKLPDPNHDFTPPPPVWRSISRATGAALLDTLARSEGAEPLLTSPDDRHPAPNPSEDVISTGAMDSSTVHGEAEKPAPLPIQPNDPMSPTIQTTHDERATIPASPNDGLA